MDKPREYLESMVLQSRKLAVFHGLDNSYYSLKRRRVQLKICNIPTTRKHCHSVFRTDNCNRNTETIRQLKSASGLCVLASFGNDDINE